MKDTTFKFDQLLDSALVDVSGGFFDQTIGAAVGGPLGRKARDKAYRRHLTKNKESNKRVQKSLDAVNNREHNLQAEEREVEKLMNGDKKMMDAFQLWLEVNADYDYTSIR